jgi:hypothetical protein
MGTYAADTSVSTEKSKAEIETTLRRYGADQFMSGWKDGQAAIQFRVNSKMVRFILPLPDLKADEFQLGGCLRSNYHSGGKEHPSHSTGCFAQRPAEVAARLWEQACRQRWRALALAIKAKLEAVECGITSFEEEFFAHLVVPGHGGKTIGQLMLHRVSEAYEGKPLTLEWDGK